MNHEDAKRFACFPKLQNALGKKHMIPDDDPITLRDVMGINRRVYMMVCAENGSSGIFIGTCGEFVDLGAFLLDAFYFQQKITMYANAFRNARKKNGTGVDPVYREYVPLMNRRVKYYYSRHVPGEPPMWIIVVEGNEVGKFWVLDECRTWMEERLHSTLYPSRKHKFEPDEEAVEQEVDTDE